MSPPSRHHGTDFGYVFQILTIAVLVAMFIALCGLCSRCAPL